LKIFIPIIFLILLTGCSNELKIERIDNSKIEGGNLTEKIQSLMQSANVTGLAVSIFNDNEVVFLKAFGYRNADTKDTLSINTIFYGASLSKAVFTHLVVRSTINISINIKLDPPSYTSI
jgi:D-alanyl-D-alanine-carboxypeptidase/D-alanyl-D-alanine-endopeptidase